MPSKHKSSAAMITVDEAVGKVLAHDITEIRPGQFKGPAFKKGQIIRLEDVEHLKRLGKEHLYVLELADGEMHEDEAALRLAEALAGPGIHFDNRPAEGKIALLAAHQGLLKVNVDALVEFNLVPDVTCSSRHTNTVVEKGATVAATRAIPLIIESTHVERAAAVARGCGGVFSVLETARPDVGLVITGNEVYSGRIEDKFAPILKQKTAAFGCRLLEIRFVPDDRSRISEAVRGHLEAGAGLVVVAGGMSVDPDDVSRLGIADAGGGDLVYGTPVLPGAMFLCGRVGDVPILGVPACVLFYRATVLDLLLPRVLAGERITREELAAMSHGGLCLTCETCRYPVCPFGK
ncbi:MAG: molybdopterin-binding protein [Deltaproteobacteria bacterium]|nr:molybdopterin-binding protein [Deltaproteobacteria bacterium]